MTVRFFWDFHGPHAEKTARHFLEHLREFLSKHDLKLECGCASDAEAHWFAYYDPPDVPQALQPHGATPKQGEETIADQVGRALRPQRVEAQVPLTD